MHTTHVVINGAGEPEPISQHSNPDTKAAVQESETVPRKCHSPMCMITFEFLKARTTVKDTNSIACSVHDFM